MERIYQLLHCDGVPEELVALVKEMNTHSVAVVRTSSEISNPFPVATWDRHGSVMGPMLFNYPTGAIMREAVREF
ncbi:hypothetical protein AAVH_19057 [Aphelenchoides avenae]|nr:hypothetical protein AAVH_19057 [Aphelenchus avenae]